MLADAFYSANPGGNGPLPICKNAGTIDRAKLSQSKINKIEIFDNHPLTLCIQVTWNREVFAQDKYCLSVQHQSNVLKLNILKKFIYFLF